MSKHQEFCCGCIYDNPIYSCYKGNCAECEMGFGEENEQWGPSNFENDIE